MWNMDGTIGDLNQGGMGVDLSCLRFLKFLSTPFDFITKISYEIGALASFCDFQITCSFVFVYVFSLYLIKTRIIYFSWQVRAQKTN